MYPPKTKFITLNFKHSTIHYNPLTPWGRFHFSILWGNLSFFLGRMTNFLLYSNTRRNLLEPQVQLNLLGECSRVTLEVPQIQERPT